MSVAVDMVTAEAEQAAPNPWRDRVVVALIAAVVASPIALAGLSLVGDTWYPVGDLSHILFRVSQVGTRATPLVGAESVKGWAHPGPLEFWLAAPLYRLTGRDPRSLMWTAALVNVACVGGLAAVAWRRGRWPLLLGVMIVAAVLAHTWGPERTASLWNPFLALFPFLLTVLLVWDAALGHRRALIGAALTASFAAQTHFAFVVLVVVLVGWLVAWSLWWRRLVPPADDGDGATAELPGPPWDPWLAMVRRALLVAGVLWLPPLFDAVFDLHNPLAIVRSVLTPPPTVGPVDAVGLVGRYVRPDGPWIGGAEPSSFLSVRGSGPVPFMVALIALVWCLQVARRRRLIDVVALATLALTLVVGAVPATSQIFLPVYSYLTQFLKLVGALVWFTVAWTVWRLVEPQVRLSASRRVAAAGVAGAVLVGVTVWTWGPASGLDTPNPREEALVQNLRAQLAGELPGGTIRVEYRGDPLNIVGPGLIYWLIHDGNTILTSDGALGLKWGHAHRWQHHERYDTLLTVAVHYSTTFDDAYEQCQRDDSARLVASTDTLSPGDRAWLEDVRLRRVADASSVSPEEIRRADQLAEDGIRVGVFEGPRVCARRPRS